MTLDTCPSWVPRGPLHLVDDNSWHLPKLSPVDPRGPLHFGRYQRTKNRQKSHRKTIIMFPQRKELRINHSNILYTPDEHSSVGLDSANVCLCLVITLVSRPLARKDPTSLVWAEAIPALHQYHQPGTDFRAPAGLWMKAVHWIFWLMNLSQNFQCSVTYWTLVEML